MLLADERHDFIRTFYSDLATVEFATLAEIHHEMVAEAIASLRHAADAERQIHLDLRYVGQEFTLQVPVSVDQIERADRAGIRAAFDALYEHRYAHHSPDEPVEMVNIRLAMIGKRPKLSFPRLAEGERAKPSRQREVYFSDTRRALPCPVYERETLGAGSEITGPALIQEHGTTTVLFEQDACTVAPSGELMITVGAA
jgi:N-methylhydantoinase A